MAYTHKSQFTWAENESRLRQELERWSVKTYTLVRGSGNPAEKSVRPSSFAETPEQAMVTLTMRWRDAREITLRYNKQARAVDNLSVLRLAVENMRMAEVRGVNDLVREAYLQLPAAPVQRSPYDVLNIQPDAPLEVAEASYKALAKLRHPDIAHDNGAAMKELNDAIKQLRQGQTAMGAAK